MPMRRIITALFLLTMALTGILALLAGCESSPAAPEFDNIFDPNGPEYGNPLHLSAMLGDSSIILSWVQPQDFGLSFYELSHSFNYNGAFLSIGAADHSENPFGTFTYENPDPTRTHYFKIQAFDLDGNYTNISDQAPATRTTPPLVAAGDGTGKVASRNITLAIVVSAGDSLRISNDDAFAEETRVAAAEPGLPVEISWLLPTAADNDTVFVVHVLAFPLSGAVDTARVELDVDFAPAFTVSGYPTSVPTRDLVLDIPSEGVVFMRFADSEASLADQAWVHGTDSFNYTLANSASPQEVWGEFLGDFGFTSTVSLTVTPDPLQEVSFALDLPDDHITDLSTVTVLAEAVASQMRFSESLDFTSVPWVAYAETSQLALSPSPGQKVIYAQFRNDWAESAILTDYVIYLSQPLDVTILAPSGGDLIPSGIPLQALGTATAASGTAPVDSVKFDSGGGAGFQDVTGTGNWSYLWDVPVVKVETPTVLRARAWAAGDSVTTTLSVKIFPEAAPE